MSRTKSPISQPAPDLPAPPPSSAPWEMPGLEEMPETTQPAEATEATQATPPAGEDQPSTDQA